MSEGETLMRLMAEGYSRWIPDRDDAAIKLERYNRSTWQCSLCGGRHPLNVNACPCGGPISKR